ncbi:unnamed protein product, partial [Didymodactylos carnosus]
AVAPGAAVIIVGSHQDQLAKHKNYRQISEHLQNLIYKRFMDTSYSEKVGYPKVIGTKDHLMLQQRIPAKYIYLEEAISLIVEERRLMNKNPVLKLKEYTEVIKVAFQRLERPKFRDDFELLQATKFLHENGVVLHYDDTCLSDLYFLDPQWLCDLLAHIITIEQINGFARHGIMRIEDLYLLFKGEIFETTDVCSYIIDLLRKFEVAVTWDNQNILIPPLLPSEGQFKLLNINKRSSRIPIIPYTKIVQLKSYKNLHDFNTSLNDTISQSKMNSLQLKHLIRVDNEQQYIYRLYQIAFIPSCFWPRLITRLLADTQLRACLTTYFITDLTMLNTNQWTMDRIKTILLNESNWYCWQTGLELRYHDCCLIRIKEVLFEPIVSSLTTATTTYQQENEKEEHDQQLNTVLGYPYRNMIFKFDTDEELNKQIIATNGSLIEICVYNTNLQLIMDYNLNQQDKDQLYVYSSFNNSLDLHINKNYSRSTDHLDVDNENFLTSRSQSDPPLLSSTNTPFIITLNVQLSTIAKILMNLTDNIDTLLEDWYPEMGTRFVQNSKGDYLVYRFIPCHKCLNESVEDKQNSNVTLTSSPSWNLVVSDSKYNVTLFSPEQGVKFHANSEIDRTRQLSKKIRKYELNESFLCHAFWIEHVIFNYLEKKPILCEKHGEIDYSTIAPDFSMRQYIEIAVKALVPVDTSNILTDSSKNDDNEDINTDKSKKLSLRNIRKEWNLNPMRSACKAYIASRQELSILLALNRHENIVPLLGLCPKPLSLILECAPYGSLDNILSEYKRMNTSLTFSTYQKLIVQIASALAHLHKHYIIYRDLKSENVLVWSLPMPHMPSKGQVLVKLSDYSISRALLPSVGTKGFAGTEGYIAPEIIRFNGEELYTEKADIFSFAMLMYELLTLEHPFRRNGKEHVRDLILQSWRPSLTQQELASPTLILDLMISCWAESPYDRPSAEDIYNISRKFEFRHLMDVVELSNKENYNEHLPLAVITFRDDIDNDDVDDEYEEDQMALPSADVWIVQHSKQELESSLIVFAYDKYNAVHERYINVCGCEIRAIHVHNQRYVILADILNCLYIFCSKTFVKLHQSILIHHHSNAQPVHMISLNEQQPLLSSIVYLLLSDNSIYSLDLLILLRNQIDASELGYRYIMNIALPTFKITALPTPSGRNVEIWAGCSLGNIRIIDVRTAQLSVQLSHQYQYGGGQTAVHLLCSNKESQYQYFVWTAMKTGCFVYVWNHLSRRIVNHIDCEKVIKQNGNDSNEMIMIDSLLPYRTFLFIGCSTGHILVVKAINVQPLTIFHAHDRNVMNIFPLSSQSSRPIIDLTIHTRQQLSQFKQLQERFEQQWKPKQQNQQRLDESKNDDSSDEISYILTYGCGAQPYQSIPQLTYGKDTIYLTTWSLEDFTTDS